MATTFANLLYHVVYSTKERVPLIQTDLREPLYEYIGGIIRGEGGVLLEQKTAVNAPDPKVWVQENITEKYENLLQLRAQIAREYPEYAEALIGFRFKGTPDPKFWDEVYNAKEALEKKHGIEIPIDTGG